MRHKARKSHSLRNALIAIVVLMVVIGVVVVAYQISGGRPGSPSSGTKVLLVTSMGNITLELYEDMSITTGNFRNLTEHGIYDETIFHRVAKGFVIQGGDATSKGIAVPPIQDELPNKHSNVRGSVAMAKTSLPNSATSQFFINLNDANAATLDSNYSVFGRVISGMDVVDNISQVPINPTDPQNPTDGKPLQDVTLIKAQIIG
jgi:peptidylprolyl isomerase